jgi:hypothetical protein
MTKSKKDKNAGAVRKIARRTVGLMLRVGDVLEAVAADAEATAPVPGVAAALPGVAVALPEAPAAAPAAVASTLPVAATVSVVEAQLPCTPPPPGPNEVVAMPPSAAPEASAEPEAVAVVVASEPVDQGARAVAAIEAYATQHNLRAVDMPGLAVLVEAVAGATTDGAGLTETRVRAVLDDQMRIHLRALGARSVPG